MLQGRDVVGVISENNDRHRREIMSMIEDALHYIEFNTDILVRSHRTETEANKARSDAVIGSLCRLVQKWAEFILRPEDLRKMYDRVYAVEKQLREPEHLYPLYEWPWNLRLDLFKRRMKLVGVTIELINATPPELHEDFLRWVEEKFNPAYETEALKNARDTHHQFESTILNWYMGRERKATREKESA